MNLLWAVFIIGLIVAVGAIPSFDLTESQALQTVLDGVKESKSTDTVNKPAGRLSCSDSEGIRTRIVKVEDGDKFITITPTGTSYTNVYIKPLDYELTKTDLTQQNNKKITILCENINGEATRFEGILVILDINDNAPVFERTGVSYQVEINEILSGSVPQQIYPPPNNPNFTNNIIVTDADGVDNNIVTAVCVGIDIGVPCAGYFAVREIRLSNGRYQFNIDALRTNYTGLSDLIIEIKARNVPLSANETTMESISQNVVIKIKDIQNLPPNIDKDTLTFEMYEDLTPGRTLGDGTQFIAAFDQDIGDPNAIRFELAETAGEPYAFVNQFYRLGTTFLDGTVYKVPLVLQKSVDRELVDNPTKTLFLDIRAIEYDPQNRPNRNPMEARETLTISIQDRNDDIPKFNAATYTIQVTELPVIANPTLFRQISNQIEIKVTDGDSILFNSFSLAIVQGNETGYFKLDKVNGTGEEVFVIYAKEEILDYERPQKSYTLRLRATDKDITSFTSEATVYIQILDANDQSPDFPSDVVTFSVNEDAAVGSLIGTITATDADSGLFGTIVAYEIREPSNTFRIDNQGRIFLNKTLDYESRSRYYFTGIAYDGGVGNNKREGTVLINVLVNNVIDVGPQFVSSYIAQLVEETKVLIPDIKVKAESREVTNRTIEYYIDAVQPLTVPLSTFSINRTSGLVTVNQFVDYKQTDPANPGSVFLTIRAQAGILNTTTVAQITIVDVNNYAPVFVPQMQNNIYYAQISELALAGDVVIDLNVTDGDDPKTLNGQVEFQIQSGANDDFLISGDSGVIIVTQTAQLDIEQRQARYEITVLARDKGSPRKDATATVIVTLVDANNKNPQFESALYRFQINEDDPVNTEIGRVTATDVDQDSILEYSIDFSRVEFQRRGNTIQDNIDPRNIIKMTTNQADSIGIIQVAGQIDRNSYDRINFNVIAQDVDPNIQGIQTGTASVVIFILAAIDPRIYFDLPWTRENPVITLTYTESKNINYQIMTLKATDPSLSETIQNYRKVPSSDPGDYFDVQGRFLYIKKALDYEALVGVYERKVSVVVEAISSDGLKTGTATIEVIVQDLNDNAPEFEKPAGYTFTVPEDKKFTYEVGRAKATDKDSTSYGQVEYYLTGSNSRDFAIYTERSGSENEAVIIVSETANLDFETTPVYNLVLVAQDNPGGTNTVKFATSVPIEIIVEDRNDLSPVFQENEYRFSIIGTQSQGGDVGFILAEDGDAGVNGEVDYFIESSTNEGSLYFNIETVDQTSARVGEVLKIGRIYVQRSLESLPDRSLFELTIQARDRGNPPTVPGQCKVYITVSKGVQDLKPKWDETLPVRVEIPENQAPGYYVTTVTAYPANATSSIIYKFLGAGDALKDYESFNIDPNTGEITTSRKLDYEQKRVYNLLILATDSMNATLFNQYLLIVQVTDIDDNDPSFMACSGRTYQIPETVYINEEMASGVFVYRAVACDLDSAPNNQVGYAWFDSPADPYCNVNEQEAFTLNEETGEIYTAQRLDREVKPEYLLCIEANKRVNGKRRKRDMVSDLKARTNHDSVLYLRVIVNDVNDLGPQFNVSLVKTVILQYPTAAYDVATAEAYDLDLAPNNGIRYSIENIDFVINGKTQKAPTAFTINANDGNIAIGTNDYTDYIGGYFNITVRAEDYNGASVPYAEQTHIIYVTDQANRIRVIFDKPADAGVDEEAKEMISKLNALDTFSYYEIESISYHVISTDQDPSYDRTDVCIVVVRDDSVMSSVTAAKMLNEEKEVKNILQRYGASDPGPCDPAASVYPIGWESYWWVLVAFAIFIFVCCLILIFMICVLYKQYKQYMDSRKTYLVPGN